MAEEGSELDLGESNGLAQTDADETFARERDTVVPYEAASDEPAEAEDIREKIEETRTQMGDTIDAIQERLSLANISEQVSEQVNNAVETAKNAVYQATIGKAAEIMKNLGNEVSRSNIVKTAKENPLPFVLIGAGAGLLAYKMLSGGSRSSNGRSRQLSSGSRNEGSSSSTLDLTGRLSGITGAVSSTAGGAYHKMTDAFGNVYTGAGEAVNSAYTRASELGSTAVEQYDHYLEENPLAVGAVALALGAAVGFAIPSTSYEGQLMGSKKQELMAKAQSSASDLVDKARDVITEAAHTIQDNVQSTTEH